MREARGVSGTRQIEPSKRIYLPSQEILIALTHEFEWFAFVAWYVLFTGGKPNRCIGMREGNLSRDKYQQQWFHEKFARIGYLD